VERGLLRRVRAELEPVAAGRPWVVLTDNNVWKHWGRVLTEALGKGRFGLIRIPAGEEHKRLAVIERICEQMVRRGADRSTLLIAFGGGVVGDIAGFAASVYLRGIDFVQIPTTLLAQVDSSVGGKTGVNLRLGKNLVGTFCQPKCVLADPEVLRTLPLRELNAGLYEAFKYGLLRRAVFEFFEREQQALRSKGIGALAELVRRCVQVKAWVVERDEREAGVRRILNLGHTAGHVLEAETSYRRFLHGEAVGWGLRAAALIAAERGLLRPADAARIHNLVAGLGRLPAIPPIPVARLAARLRADKKTRAGVTHFVLPARIGKVVVASDVTLDSVARALGKLREEGRVPQRRKGRGGPQRGAGE
jgi:3-dehydroquinate synthase